MNRIASQYSASRRVVRIEWIDSVRSDAYYPAKVAIRAGVNTTVVVTSETPKLSTILSGARVPAVLLRTMTNQ